MKIKFQIILILLTFITINISNSETNNTKMRLIVLDFENQTRLRDVAIGEGVSKMLTTSLVNSGKFRVVERGKVLKEILKEQELQMTGVVDTATAVKVGRIFGAQAVILGEVTEFGIRKKSVGFGCFLLAFFGKKKIISRVVIDARVVSVETAEVIMAAHGEGEETSESTSGSALPITFEFGTDGFDSTTIGKATRKAINQVVNKLSNMVN